MCEKLGCFVCVLADPTLAPAVGVILGPYCWALVPPERVPRFTVDTQLFRELGELLVGRDSTALTELVKNSYDADATRVRIVGQSLRDGEDGMISVFDDGTGMTGDEFRTGYLTIAGRGKEMGDRRSRRFGRRFTGEKGIGRLATHKLAHELDVQSVAAQRKSPRGREQVRARIDWDAIERYATLADIRGDALQVRRSMLDANRHSGTAIVLRRLRHDWSEADLSSFVVELTAFEPPQLLTEPLPHETLPESLIFSSLPLRDAAANEAFSLELEGDFERSEEFWRQVADTANWVVEIDSSRDGVTIAISPTRRTTERVEAEPLILTIPPPGGSLQPRFAARILARENSRGTRRTREFVSEVAGVRVFMEGFRVPPYGDRGNDWLGLDRAYARRSPRLELDIPGMPAASPGREGLRGLPNNAYVGAVLLTRAGAPELQVLINREGFLPSAHFDAIRETVRTALDLLTRIRAQHGVAEGSLELTGETVPVILSAELRVRDGVRAAAEQARALRTVVADLGSPRLQEGVMRLVEGLDELDALAEHAVADRSLLRVLASVGTQMAAFIHETQGLVGAAAGVSRSLGLLAERYPDYRRELLDLSQTVVDIGRRIDGQARYLSDATAVSSRRRRRRMPLAERFGAARDLVRPVAERMDITIDNEIPEDVRTTPMFPAELTVILSNLVTNAVKAAGRGGRIRARARRKEGTQAGLVIRVENTGVAVDPAGGEQWFAPFASTTMESLDPILGQGMGLGLPITRSMVEDYRGSVRFVTPSSGFATALEIRLP